VNASLEQSGLQPYRTGSQSAPTHPERYAELLEQLKAALDPNGVLAPGKSGIGSGSRSASQ